MGLKNWLVNKIKYKFEQFAFSAVVYAEEYIGGGKGQAKKELAIEYLINLLPTGFKPFAGIFKRLLTSIADSLIEKAVEKLHALQQLEGFSHEN